MGSFRAKTTDDHDADGDPSSLFTGLDWLKLPAATKQQGSSPTAAAAARGALKPLTSNTGRGAQLQPNQQAAAVSKVHARRPRAGASLPGLSPTPLLQEQQHKHAVPAQPASVLDRFPGDGSDPDSETQQERAANQPQPAARRPASSSKHTLQHSNPDLDLFGSNAGAARQQQQQQPNKSAAATFGRPARKEAAAAAPDGYSWLQPLGLPSARLPDAAAAAAAGSSKQQTNKSSLPVFTLPDLTAAAERRAAAPKAAAAADCQIMSAQGELELLLLSQDKHAACGFDSDNSLGSMQQQEEAEDQEQEEDHGQEQTRQRRVPAAATLAAAAAAAQGKLDLGSRQLKNLSTHQQQQQLAASKQSKFGSAFDFAANSQGDGSEGSQGAGDGAESSGYSASLSDNLSDAASDSGSDGAAADAAASLSSGSLWSGGSSRSGGSGSSAGDAGSAHDSDVSFVAEGNSRKRKQTGQGPAGLKLMRQKGATAAAKAAHKAVRFADEDGEGHVACEPQQQRKQQQQQQQKRQAPQRRSSSNAARGSSVVLELGAMLPGEVPLLLPPGRNLTRSGILLVELPAGFDAEGDAGAIGRVVCNPAAAATAAGAAGGPAVARVAGTLQDRKRRTAGNKPAAAAGTAAAAGSSGDEAVSSDTLSDGNDSAGGSGDDGMDCAGAGADATAAAVPVLDLKGTIYDLQELLLAGTAAVVRINAPAGKGAAAAGKPGPTAHMEHLLGSFVRAVPSAAAVGADQDYCEAFEFGLLDADEDVFGVAAVAAGGVGGEGGGGVGGGGRGGGSRAGGRGRGRGGKGGAGKKARGGVGVSGLAALGLGGGARKGKGGGKVRGGGRGGKRRSAAGRKPAKAAGGPAKKAAAARAAPAAGGGKVSSSKVVTKKKVPWETDSDVEDISE